MNQTNIPTHNPMKILKALPIFILGLVVNLVSCDNQESKDPQKELDLLKGQQLSLNTKIQSLEKKLAQTGKVDSSLINFKQVSISPVQYASFQHLIEVQGKVESDLNIDVNPKMMGIITKIFVTEGQNVSKGQVLATIDNELLNGNLEQLKSQYNLAVILYQKQKNLWDQQIGTEVQFLQAKNNKENLEKSMELIKEQLAQTRIVSPINGNVDQIFAKIGQTAAAGSPQFRIVNTDVLKITGGLGENYIDQIKIGQPLRIEFPDAGKTIQTKVSFVSRVVDPITRTFTVQTKLSGQRDIKPNMIVIMHIQDYYKPKTIVIPVNMIQNGVEGSFIYIAEKGKNPKYGIAKKKIVKTGLIQDGNIEIKSGIDPSDQLITVGFQGLSEGTSLSF